MIRFKALIRLFLSNWREMVDSSGLKNPFARAPCFVLFFLPSIFFTARIYSFDRKIGSFGLTKGCQWLLEKYYFGTETKNLTVPETGGVLLLSNHPGLGDSLAVLSSLNREDIKIAAFDKEFFKALPNLYKRIIPIEENPVSPQRNARAFLEILDQLRRGGMILLYPAGKIEPDPAFRRGRKLLLEWKEAAAILAMKAERAGFEFKILSLMISRVYTEKAYEMPFVSGIKDEEEKDKLAALWILLTKMTKSQKIIIESRGLTGSRDLVKEAKTPRKIQEELRSCYDV